MITLSMLDSAFQKIEAIGREELEFEIAGTVIVLRNLSASEEVLVQKYAQEALSGGETDNATAMDYLDRFKNAVLSYSIIKIGDQDLRNVKYIETGELTSTGSPVRVSKDKAVRELLSKWPRQIVLSLFERYGELSTKVEQKTEQAVKMDISSIDAEIERLQERISDLQRRKLMTTEDPIENKTQKVIEENKEALESRRAAVKNSQDQKRVPEDQSAQTTSEVKKPESAPASTPTTSGAAVIPQRKTPVMTAPQNRVPEPVSQPRVEEIPKADPVRSFGGVEGSYTSGSEEELAAEEQRILAMRRNAMQEPVARKVPPHIAARQSIERAGQVEGVDAYRLPHQELEAPTPRVNTSATFDEVPTGHRNPKFNPPRR